MKFFGKIFLYGIPFGLGFILSLISIVYATKLVAIRFQVDEIFSAIFFGIIGLPLVWVSSARIAVAYKETSL